MPKLGHPSKFYLPKGPTNYASSLGKQNKQQNNEGENPEKHLNGDFEFTLKCIYGKMDKAREWTFHASTTCIL